MKYDPEKTARLKALRLARDAREKKLTDFQRRARETNAAAEFDRIMSRLMLDVYADIENLGSKGD